jgi:hypothetical protein
MMKTAHVNDQFRSLQAFFKLTRECLEKARTLEEKCDFWRFPREIINGANLQMTEFRAYSPTPDSTRVKKREKKNDERRIEIPGVAKAPPRTNSRV